MVDRPSRRTRDEKLENLIVNHTTIFMGTFEEAFSAIADRITEAAVLDTSGPKDGRTPSSGTRASKELAPDVLTQISQVFSGIREEMDSQWPKDASVFVHYVSNPLFDRGIEIVEKYDFGRPKLTERLSDQALVSYVFLLKSGDKELSTMFRELADWRSGLPKPPWAP